MRPDYNTDQPNNNKKPHTLDADLAVLVAADDVVQGGGAEEVLLLETQLLALEEVVVGVQHPRDVLGNVAVQNGADVVTAVERRQLKVDRGLGRPQAESVDNVVLVSGDRVVVRHGQYGAGVDPLGLAVHLWKMKSFRTTPVRQAISSQRCSIPMRGDN